MDCSETCLSVSVRQYFLHDPRNTGNPGETFLLDELEIDFERILGSVNRSFEAHTFAILCKENNIKIFDCFSLNALFCSNKIHVYLYNNLSVLYV